MAHAAEEKLAAVDASFIKRTIVGATAANVLKGVVWGNAVAISQSLATSFHEVRTVASAAGKAIDMTQLKAGTFKNMTTFWPSIVVHTAFFAAYRGNGSETIGITGGIKPLLVTAVPTIAYAAYTRAPPPTFLRHSLYSCVLLHVYDRIWHPKGLNTEALPTAHMNRRVY